MQLGNRRMRVCMCLAVNVTEMIQEGGGVGGQGNMRLILAISPTNYSLHAAAQNQLPCTKASLGSPPTR